MGQSWGLLLLNLPLLAWAVAQTVWWLQQAWEGPGPAHLAPASSTPGFLTLFNTEPKEAGESASPPSIKVTGKGRGMTGFGVLRFG